MTDIDTKTSSPKRRLQEQSDDPMKRPRTDEDTAMRRVTNMSKEILAKSRTTPDKLISVIDAIAVFRGCSNDVAGKLFRRCMKDKSSDILSELLSDHVTNHVFTGQGQRSTPVAKLITCTLMK